MIIQIGAKCETEREVTPDMTAYQMGSGLLPVLATPAVAAMMENAAMNALQGFLEKGQGSVGTQISMTHVSPTPVGMKVWASAEITEVSADGRRIDFAVRAWDECGTVSTGTHTRAIIQNERFLERCQAKGIPGNNA